MTNLNKSTYLFQIARIEQTETPDMMQERIKHQEKKVTKFDKVVKREVCQITNRGTQVFGQQVPLTNNHQTNYMLAVAERHSAKSNRFSRRRSAPRPSSLSCCPRA